MLEIKNSDFLLLCAVLCFIPAVIVKFTFKILSLFSISPDVAIVISGAFQDFSMAIIIYCAYKAWKLPKISFLPIRKIDVLFRGFIEFIRVSCYAFFGNLIGFAVFFLLYTLFGINPPLDDQYLIQQLKEEEKQLLNK